ncbi:ClpP/crotonase-like domain-containing protein [Fimicolochytrium jonesii]|uniref:ClpP/crotonase-like domain-containing protein n=1 Tax=Fimicolochytrium jonesii TaxID=1396493 RepID=UPI0022FE7DD5|nr:ClpP/crotonase-like domain-containing protein [Fimicolochytrium jonesii]KAI8826533.1 ClpP/crotonase-like domain-containing protein [Fimicolochytrium jonesii]
MTPNPTSPIQVLTTLLRQHYVFPDQLAFHIQSRLESGAYDSLLTDEPALANLLSQDLLHVNNDGHLGVTYSPAVLGEDLPVCPAEEELPVDEEDGVNLQQLGGGGLINFGLRRVECLKGGVGLLVFQGFFPLALSGPVITSAFTILASTHSLIIDLRTCFGVDGSTADFVLSYLVPRAIHTNSVHWRPSNTTEQLRTLPYVPGPRYQNARCIPSPPHALFRVLTSSPASISIGCTTNKVLGRGWEGLGVKPDMECAPEVALDVAHRLALRESKGEGEEGLGQLGRMVKEERRAELERLEGSLGQLGL